VLSIVLSISISYNFEYLNRKKKYIYYVSVVNIPDLAKQSFFLLIVEHHSEVLLQHSYLVLCHLKMCWRVHWLYCSCNLNYI